MPSSSLGAIPSVDSANWPWPTNDASEPRRASPGRAARGSVVPRKMACHSAAGRQVSSLGPRPSTRARRGSLLAAPFKWGENGRRDARPCFVCRPVALLCRSCVESATSVETAFWTSPCRGPSCGIFATPGKSFSTVTLQIGFPAPLSRSYNRRRRGNDQPLHQRARSLARTRRRST